MTQRFARYLVAMLLGALVVLPQAAPVLAQGTTTAAISGRIGDNTTGRPLSGAEVEVRNVATGTTRTTVSNADGQYLVPGLAVGGPYMVRVTTLGFARAEQPEIRLSLGQNLVLNFQLSAQAVALQAIDVTAELAGQIMGPNRTGAVQLVTEAQIANLPTISRNFTDFIVLSPLVGGGGNYTSVGGQNNRFNSIQIDGALAQDLFGLGATGQPGGQAGARSISLEAVKEYQVLAAPYDIRQSGFSGGMINAVTKTGTNQFRGSVFGFTHNQDLIRDMLVVRGDTLNFKNEEFTNRLIGATMGGPIIRDRAHFFLAVEFETDQRPGGTLAVGRDPESTTGVAVTDANRFAAALRALNVEPGTFMAREDNSPNNNIFARVDAQLSPSHMLTLRHNWVHAEDDIVVNRNVGPSYSFDSNWYFFQSNTSSSVAQLNSVFGGFYNEFSAGYTRIRDRRSPNERFPVVQVTIPNQAGTGTKRLLAGAEYFSQGNELDQDALELTNNVRFSRGNHRITVGAQAQYFKFRNLFQAGKTGEWTFNSLAELEAGNPSAYRRAVPAPGVEDPNARNSLVNTGIYAQTEWTGIQNVTLTAGLRYDVPITLDDGPIYNPLVEQRLNRRTDEVPSGNGLISPRLGFNWDVTGDRVTQLRGGIGAFAGRHPYVWLSNLYGNTGLSTVTISCSRAAGNLPAFTLDPDNQPATCAATGVPAPGRPVVNLVDPDFKYPQNLRGSLGVDRILPWDIVGTVDFMYTRALQQIFLRELNVNFDQPVSTTQGGRPVFGRHRAGVQSGNNNTLATPNRYTTDINAVVELTNSNQDRSWSVTAQAQKRFTNNFDLNASYTFMDAKDVSSLTSSIATSNIGYNPVQGSPNSPPLATSDYQTRHKVVFSGIYEAASWLTVSGFYVGTSADGYSYVYDGDVNADGYEGAYANNRFNDLLYVPLNQQDITLVNPADWARLNQFIETEACLQQNRGTILERNACQEPWQNRLDARLAFRVPTVRGQRAELSLDVINVLNLVNSEWGVNRGMVNATADLLELRGWDTANNRGIFQPTGFLKLDEDGKANPFNTFTSQSRWQMQLGVKYSF